MSVNQHGPCAGKAPSVTTGATAVVVVVADAGAVGVAGVVVAGVVAVGTTANSGRHTLPPGYSGDAAVAWLAWYRAVCDTEVFFAMANHESPFTTW